MKKFKLPNATDEKSVLKTIRINKTNQNILDFFILHLAL